jgi:hypothetical protein
MLSLFAMNFHAGRLGLEAQNAMVFRFLRLFSASNKTRVPEILAGEIALPHLLKRPTRL